MGTDYSVLATQSAGGTPGAGYANQIKDNQEALVHPPSARFVCAAQLGAGLQASEPSPLTAATYGKVNFGAPKFSDTPGTAHSSQSWQNDVSSTSSLSSPFVDSTNNTYSGASLVAFPSVGFYDLTNSFKVPKAGIYLVTAWVGVAATTGVLTVAFGVNAARGVAYTQIAGAGSGATGTSASVSTLLDLSTSDYFDVQARHSTGTTVTDGALSIVRVSEAAD